MANYLTAARLQAILQKLAPWFVNKEADALLELADEVAGNAYDDAYDFYQLADARLDALEAASGGGEWGTITGTLSDQTDLQAALDAKASTTHNHDANYAPIAHTHAISDSTGLQAALDGKAASTHGHVVSDVTGLQAALDGKAASTHTHAIADVTNLQTSLDAKLNSSSYTAADVLAKLITVDGTGSGLDADLLDGNSSNYYMRVDPRRQSVTSAATVTPDAASNDMVLITAQAEALSLANPSGTPYHGQRIIIRIKDNGTARAISYGTQYRAMGNTLPTTTVAGKTLYLGIIWNGTDSKWDLIAKAAEL